MHMQAQVLLERLRNDITRLTAVKGWGEVAASPLVPAAAMDGKLEPLVGAANANPHLVCDESDSRQLEWRCIHNQQMVGGNAPGAEDAGIPVGRLAS